ncbi:hypothetical protein OCU04_012610 [Sclerotinia nivalis]|uniref:Uncharacterized protein n=1 Tax=Sclerotinia nivalis TaxID=352851 RepID=A0A9X0A937_9HELO|nr:hypothetical protein OCU04_012610 [Sclerotinia nivalis]
MYTLAKLINSENGYHYSKWYVLYRKLETYNSFFLTTKRNDPNEGIWKVLPFKGVRSGEVKEDIDKAEKEAVAVFSILQSMFAIPSKNEAGTTTLHAYIPERDGIKTPFALSLINPDRAAIKRVQSALATSLISCKCIHSNAHPEHKPNPHSHANPYQYIELNKGEEGRNSVYFKLEE